MRHRGVARVIAAGVVIACAVLMAAPLPMALAQEASPAPAETARPEPAPSTETAPPKTIEEITVLGKQKGAERVIHDFVGTFTVPVFVTGQIARWKVGVCPETHGLEPAFEKFITARVKAVAAQVGAGPPADDHCHTNTRIIITPDPQGVMNHIAAKSPNYLGFHFVAQTKALATVRYPIQAWYATQTEDINGQVMLDTPDVCDVMRYGKYTGDTCFTLNGSRIRPGWRSEFAQVTVVVDMKKIADLQIGAVADYIAMLALSETKGFDTCRELPSITNLMSPNCDASKKTAGLTAYDLAYLRALYQSDPLAAAGLGQDDVAYWMNKDLQHP